MTCWRLIAVLVVCLARVALAQTPATQPTTWHALDLAGTNSWAEFPAQAFTNLGAATVEGWVKWRRFDYFSRFFDFGGTNQFMSVSHRQLGGDLEFELWTRDRPRNQRAIPRVFAANIVSTNEWYHIAAVSGPHGMKLYLNGALVASTNYAGSFAQMEENGHNYLGRKVMYSATSDARTDGQMAEVRVWSLERTAKEIRENLGKQLTGDEKGLVSLWNFEKVTNGVLKDAGPGGHDGRLEGEATIVEAQLPPVRRGEFGMRNTKAPPPAASSVPARSAPNLAGTNSLAIGPSGINHVLSLNGEDSYVELPVGSLTNLTEATVEGWLKWERLGKYSRFFDFGSMWHA